MIRLLLFLLGALIPALHAQDLPAPLFFTEHDNERFFFEPLPQAPTAAAPSEQRLRIDLSDEDLRSRPQLTEMLLNQAVADKDWDTVAQLLPIYRAFPEHDPLLADFAQGGLWRSEGRYRDAIALYRRLDAAHPELLAVQLDLALMLFENRQLREAEQQFRHLGEHQEPAVRELARRYREAIAERQRWNSDFSFSYTRTDNVNNAPSAAEIDLHGRRFYRDPDALPQKAHGLRYDFSLGREKNLGGNHYAALQSRLDGIHYFNARDYHEQSLSLQAGYRYRDVRQNYHLQPFIARQWLGGEAYSHLYGISLGGQRRLGATTQIGGQLRHSRRHYSNRDLSPYYDGFTNSLHLNFLWQAHPQWVLFSGGEISRERTRDLSESSWRRGAHLGSEHKNPTFGFRLSVGYDKRRFSADNFYSGSRREDDEYRADLSLWATRLHYHGITPKLNYRYRKIDSNLDALYTRSSGEWHLSFEKAF